MTTSNTTNFSMSTYDCCQMALEEINVMGEGDELQPYNYGLVKKRLNLMLKDWQNFASHLWVRQKISVFLQAKQPSYSISTTSTDHITADIPAQTQLTADNAIGDSVITVKSTAGFTAGNYIGIQTNDSNFFWTTVTAVISPTTIQLTNTFITTASSGLYVFGYTNQVTSIFNPTAAVRRLITSNNDTPIIPESYLDYLNRPNKFNLGTVNTWSYDRQLDNMIINVWQSPSDVSNYMIMAVDRKIQDVNFNADTFDIPQEMANAVMLNLAVQIAPAFGKAQGENFAKTESNAKEALIRALENDNELGSLYFMPSRNGVRGR